MIERWGPIAEFPSYSVSTCGRVQNTITGHVLRPGGRTQRGYIQYHLFVNGRRYARYIHRLVAATFIDPNIDGLEIDHIDDDNTNNRVDNLEIVTPKINSQRGYDRGRRIPPSMKAVRVIETGEEFRSVSDCARALDRGVSAVWYALQHGTSTAGIHLQEVIS